MNAARRYQRALKAIRRRLSSATYRDAQFVYRQLRAESLAPLSAKQIDTSRLGTLRRQLTRARALGSRTRQLPKKQQRKVERAAKEFNPGTKERADVPSKERRTLYTLADWEKAYAQSTVDTREPIEIETSPDYVRDDRRPQARSASTRRPERLGDTPRRRATLQTKQRALAEERDGLTPEDRAAVEAAIDDLRAERARRTGQRRKRRRARPS